MDEDEAVVDETKAEPLEVFQISKRVVKDDKLVEFIDQLTLWTEVV